MAVVWQSSSLYIERYILWARVSLVKISFGNACTARHSNEFDTGLTSAVRSILDWIKLGKIHEKGERKRDQERREEEAFYLLVETNNRRPMSIPNRDLCAYVPFEEENQTWRICSTGSIIVYNNIFDFFVLRSFYLISTLIHLSFANASSIIFLFFFPFLLEYFSLTNNITSSSTSTP